MKMNGVRDPFRGGLVGPALAVCFAGIGSASAALVALVLTHNDSSIVMDPVLTDRQTETSIGPDDFTRIVSNATGAGQYSRTVETSGGGGTRTMDNRYAFQSEQRERVATSSEGFRFVADLAPSIEGTAPEVEIRWAIKDSILTTVGPSAFGWDREVTTAVSVHESVSLMAVPEPGTAILLCSVAIFAGRRQRTVEPRPEIRAGIPRPRRRRPS